MRLSGSDSAPQVDAVVVGAGFGGLYALHALSGQGLAVRGFEGAPDVGGVWYHNRYPGARVDIECYDYCYYFDPDLYAEWKWTERFPGQPEILAYLNHVAERYDLRRLITFESRVTGAAWDPALHMYTVTASTGESVTCRYLVMATGQLSSTRTPDLPGLGDFAGRWYETSHWPREDVDFRGKRVGVIGTGSSGTQAITEIAKTCEHLYVFQRTPNYAIPARNGPVDQERHRRLAENVPSSWEALQGTQAGVMMPTFHGESTEFGPDEQRRLIAERWQWGGQSINSVFSDQGTSEAANELVAGYVREQVRAIVEDPAVAEVLAPGAYPIGTRRLAVTTEYYETFNRPNVTLVDIKTDPIDRVTESGLKTAGNEYDVDILVLALGFDAFTGSLDKAGIRNEKGRSPTSGWDNGPRTYLGLMTRGFPNLFIITGPGSPSVLANMVTANVQHIDFVVSLLQHMAGNGHTRVEPSATAEREWDEHVQEVARPLLRYRHDNYMVHVHPQTGERNFIPYVGGFDRYVGTCRDIAERAFDGFEFAS